MKMSSVPECGLRTAYSLSRLYRARYARRGRALSTRGRIIPGLAAALEGKALLGRWSRGKRRSVFLLSFALECCALLL